MKKALVTRIVYRIPKMNSSAYVKRTPILVPSLLNMNALHSKVKRTILRLHPYSTSQSPRNFRKCYFIILPHQTISVCLPATYRNSRIVAVRFTKIPIFFEMNRTPGLKLSVLRQLHNPLAQLLAKLMLPLLENSQSEKLWI